MTDLSSAPEPVPDQVMTALTTEHFGLIGARSQAASESATRSALYLGTLSSVLIGLGLTAQVSDNLTIFFVYALVALPTLFLLGVFTLIRLVELGAEDMLLGRAINRIRSVYLDHAGPHRRLYLLVGNDDATGVMANMGLQPRRSHLYFTVAVAVGTVNAVVAGAVVAIAVGLAFDAPLAACVVIGLVVTVLVTAGTLRFQAQRRGQSGPTDEVLFPSPSGTTGGPAPAG